MKTYETSEELLKGLEEALSELYKVFSLQCPSSYGRNQWNVSAFRVMKFLGAIRSNPIKEVQSEQENKGRYIKDDDPEGPSPGHSISG